MSTKTEYAQGQFCWVDLVAHDMEAAAKFYGELLGWECAVQDTHGGPPYGIFRTRGLDVAGIGEMGDEMKSQGRPPAWNSYINVDDVAAVVQRATDLGAAVTVPAMQVLDAGWLAFIQDPTGGHIGFWQKNRHFGAALVNDPGAFCWNELATRDVDASKDFYSKLLGWEYADNPQSPAPYFLIKNRGSDNGGIMQMTAEWGDVPPHWSVYFTVENVNESVEQLKGSGGHVHVPPFDTPVGPVSVVADPQGATFSIISLESKA